MAKDKNLKQITTKITKESRKIVDEHISETATISQIVDIGIKELYKNKRFAHLFNPNKEVVEKENYKPSNKNLTEDNDSKNFWD